MEKKSMSSPSTFAFLKPFRFDKKKEVTEAVRFINEIVEVIPEQIKKYQSIYSIYSYNKANLKSANSEYNRAQSNHCENDIIYINMRNSIDSMIDENDRYTNILINISIDLKKLFRCLNNEMGKLCDTLTQTGACSISYNYSADIGCKLLFLAFIEYFKYEAFYSFSICKEYFFSHDYPIYKIFFSLENGKKMLDSYFNEEQYFSLTKLI